MIRETVADALKSDNWTFKDAAKELDVSADALVDFCRVSENDSLQFLDDVCEFLNLKLMRVFTRESWESYVEDSWNLWGSKEPAIAYATSKAEEWAEYSHGQQAEGKDFEVWSQEFDEKEFDAWEALAVAEFEKSERVRLEKTGWVRWD